MEKVKREKQVKRANRKKEMGKRLRKKMGIDKNKLGLSCFVFPEGHLPSF
jgi:hypothetical protein